MCSATTSGVLMSVGVVLAAGLGIAAQSEAAAVDGHLRAATVTQTRGLKPYTSKWWAKKNRVVAGCVIVTRPKSPYKSHRYTQCDYRTGYNMDYSTLNHANLRYANFVGTPLYRADLRGTKLRGASFQRADMTRADLRGADLRGVSSLGDLYGANMRGARMKQIDYNTLHRDSWMDTSTICPNGRHAVSLWYVNGAKCQPFWNRYRPVWNK